MRIGFPADLFEIVDELFAARIDNQPMLAIMISQQSIDAVDSILHRWISAGHSEVDSKQIGVTAEEVYDDLPIGARGRGSVLLAGGVPMDIHFQGPFRPPLLRTIQELFAGLQRVGIGLDYFLQDMYLGAVEVRQHRAERVGVEIQRPA